MARLRNLMGYSSFEIVKEQRWSFREVKPDFLHATGYYTASEGDKLPDFAYFDGAAEDTCAFFYKDALFYLLLTNGSP